MAVDEQAWRRAMTALEGMIGVEEANALVQEFWNRTARRDDLEMWGQRLDSRITGVEERLDSRITSVEERLDSRITGVEERLSERIDWSSQLLAARIDGATAEVTATMRGELNAQVRSLMFGFVGLQATIGAFVVALGRFVL